MTELRIGLVGHQKMGRAHSQAYLTAPRFFERRTRPVLQAVCGRNAGAVAAMASRFGWRSVETDWRRLIERDDIDLIDITTPNALHQEIAAAAIAVGKHVVCEKPLALTAPAADEMADAAVRAGVRHMVMFTYRFVPAVAMAKRLIDDGALGQVYSYVGVFQQDWLADPEAPMTWRLRAEDAGTGVLGDLGAHQVDLAQHLVGDIEAVTGALHTVVPQRPNEQGDLEAVTVDDAYEAMINFTDGVTGTLAASRVATGQKTRNRFEIYGSGGAIQYDFGSMNELRLLSTADPLETRGFRTISTLTPGVEPYAAHWWGAGHHLGFEHTFVHAVAELLQSFDEDRMPTPGFEAGASSQRVLDAIVRSSRDHTRTPVHPDPIQRRHP